MQYRLETWKYTQVPASTVPVRIARFENKFLLICRYLFYY